MKKIIYIYIVLASLESYIINAQEYKSHFKNNSKEEVLIESALKSAKLNDFTRKESEIGSQVDSTVLFNNGKKSVKFEFTYNSIGSVIQILYFLTDSNEIWKPIQKKIISYKSNGAVATMIYQDSSSSGWKNYKKIDFEDVQDFYKEWKWEDYKWVGEESIEAFYNSQNMIDTIYHGVGEDFACNIKIGFSYYPNGLIQSEHLYELSDNNYSWLDKGVYTYTYYENGTEKKISYTDTHNGTEYWKKEFKYIGDVCETNVYDLIDDNWILGNEESIRKDEVGNIVSLKSYDNSQGFKEGLEYYETEFNYLNLPIRNLNYSWNLESSEWHNDYMLIYEWNEEGYSTYIDTKIWSEDGWINKYREVYTYDENKRLHKITTNIWNDERLFPINEQINYYADSNATATEPNIKNDLDNIPFIVRDKTVSLNDDNYSIENFSIYDMEGKLLELNRREYTFYNSGTYIIYVKDKGYKISIK